MDKLIDLLGEVFNRFRVHLQDLASVRDLGLASYQARLLAVVSRRPGCSQQELANWTGRDKAQVARTIKELEARGLLARSPHRSDWRSHSLALTADGEASATVIARERYALGSTVMQGLTPEERRVVIVALKKMKERLVTINVDPDRGQPAG